MAIAHLHAKIIGATRSPIAAAAYRHRSQMSDVAQGKVVSYQKAGRDLAHEEIALPADAPAWLRLALADRSVSGASEALWTAVYYAEKRVDAQFARDLDIALPKELTLPQQVALMRDFIESQFSARGMVADWVIHNDPDNPHAHIMHTLRPLTAEGFGSKMIALRDENGQPKRAPNGKIIYRKFIGADREDLKAMRATWEEITNKHLALAGHDARIDMRSYAAQGIGLPPTTHIGPEALAIDGARGNQERVALHEISRREAAAEIHANPFAIVQQLAGQHSTFTERDIARVLNRYIDEPTVFTNILDRIRAHPEMMRLRENITDPETGLVVAPAVYATREQIRIEHQMAIDAEQLHAKRGFSFSARTISAKIAAVETRNLDPARHFKFDDEQVAAVEHVTGPGAIAAVVGFAGAGKSTLLEAANLAWQSNGHRVFGAALAGKAAEGLEQSAGIPSRTLAAWRLAWENGRDTLKKGDVFVVDEAGMVSSRELATVTAAVRKAGAKLVLVGDAMQLQPIEAGAAFRAVTDRIGAVELVGIRRQKTSWAQHASRQFARGDAREALNAYRDQGAIHQPADRDAAIASIVNDWTLARRRHLADNKPPRGDEILVLAATNADVFALNQAIRRALTATGELQNPHTIDTERGARDFAAGDRVIFLKNQKFEEPAAPQLGTQAVKNGMLGTVISTDNGLMRVTLDNGRAVAFRANTYRNVDHGYATTVHKAQGITVDDVFVLAGKTFDQHLAYVAMSRHRDSVTLYAPQSDFKSFATLTRTLSRNRAKTTTLDFTSDADYRTAAAPYMERRALDTLADIAPAFAQFLDRQHQWIAEQSEKLTDLWSRAQAALQRIKSAATTPNTSSAAAAPALQPYPAMAAQTQFPASVCDTAAAALLSNVNARRFETTIAADLKAAYHDGPAAIAAINAALKSGATAAQITRAITETPEQFGAITERAAAQRLANPVRLHATAFTRDLPDAIRQEDERRRALGSPVPALSAPALAAVASITAGKTTLKDLAGNTAVADEIKAVSDAIAARFGTNAFLPRETTQDRKNAANRVAPEHRDALNAARTTLATIRKLGSSLYSASQSVAAERLHRPGPHSPLPRTGVPTGSPPTRQSSASMQPSPSRIGASPMNAVTTEIEGDVARVAFPYDQVANSTFRKALGNIPTKHQNGAWEIKLPTNDAAFRDRVVKLVDKAAAAVEPRIQELANSASRAGELASYLNYELGDRFNSDQQGNRHPETTPPNMSVEERNGNLAIKIPPVQDAIDEIKSLGASWVPKNTNNPQNGGYWKLAVKGEGNQIDAPFMDTVVKSLEAANTAILADTKNKSLATTIVSPHPEIHLATKGDRLLVSTPQMAETNAMLKADGPAKMTWDNNAKAFAVRVTPENVDEVTNRLAAVKTAYDTALIPPHAGKPGVILDPKTATLLDGAKPKDYATNPEVKKAIVDFTAAVGKALSDEERVTILNHGSSLLSTDPKGVPGLERIAALQERGTLGEVAAIMKDTAKVATKGEALIAKQQEKTQEQSKDQGVGR